MDPNVLNAELNRIDQDVLKSSFKDVAEIKSHEDRIAWADEARQHRNAQRIIADVHNVGTTNLSATERRGAENQVAIEQTTSRLDNSIYRTAADISNTMQRQISDLKTDVYRAQAAAERGTGQVQLETSKVAANILSELKSDYISLNNTLFGLSKDIQTSKADIMLSNAKDFACLGRQAAENAAAIQLESLKNASNIEKQLGMHYADISNKILQSEGCVKDLIEKSENDRLRDALRSNENKALYFELRHHHHSRSRSRGRHSHHGH